MFGAASLKLNGCTRSPVRRWNRLMSPQGVFQLPKSCRQKPMLDGATSTYAAALAKFAVSLVGAGPVPVSGEFGGCFPRPASLVGLQVCVRDAEEGTIARLAAGA